MSNGGLGWVGLDCSPTDSSVDSCEHTCVPGVPGVGFNKKQQPGSLIDSFATSGSDIKTQEKNGKYT